MKMVESKQNSTDKKLVLLEYPNFNERKLKINYIFK